MLSVFPSQRTGTVWEILYLKQINENNYFYSVFKQPYLQSVTFAETNKLYEVYLCIHLCHTNCITPGKWYLM